MKKTIIKTALVVLVLSASASVFALNVSCSTQNVACPSSFAVVSSCDYTNETDCNNAGYVKFCSESDKSGAVYAKCGWVSHSARCISGVAYCGTGAWAPTSS